MQPELLFQPISFNLLDHFAKHFLNTEIMFDTKLQTEEPNSDYVTEACFKTKLNHSIIPPFDQFQIFTENPDAFERYFAVFVIAVEERNFSYSIIHRNGFKEKPINIPVSSYKNKKRYGVPYNFFLMQEIDSLYTSIQFKRIVEKFEGEWNTHLQIKRLRAPILFSNN